MIFINLRDNIGKTHGIKFKINPPNKAINKIFIKFSFSFQKMELSNS